MDVVDGSVRSYGRSMFGGPGRGLSSATTRTRYWSPSSAGIGMVGGRAVWAGQVVTFDVSGSGAVIGVGGRCGRDGLRRAAGTRWGKAYDWSGVVWCKSALPAGISRF